MPISIDTPNQPTDDAESHPSQITDMSVSVTTDEEGGFETYLGVDAIDISSTDENRAEIETQERARDSLFTENEFRNEDMKEDKEILTAEAIVPEKSVHVNEEELVDDPAEAKVPEVDNRKRIVIAIAMILIVIVAIVIGVVVATAKGPPGKKK